ncbi:hypothetical protein NPIL_316121 [Nephila pilipes]|uniref:Uncharacterized protein n=1 Tax=Nephila pilipes TaxID=299642 RepID=A0A8X6NGC8_NEPPI|nr:hypothetical protein NPIL_316121 [Nephila pilipes]
MNDETTEFELGFFFLYLPIKGLQDNVSMFPNALGEPIINHSISLVSNQRPSSTCSTPSWEKRMSAKSRTIRTLTVVWNDLYPTGHEQRSLNSGYGLACRRTE